MLQATSAGTGRALASGGEYCPGPFRCVLRVGCSTGPTKEILTHINNLQDQILQTIKTLPLEKQQKVLETPLPFSTRKIMYFICPGIHDPQLTENFQQSLARQSVTFSCPLILPTDSYPPFSPWHVLQFLQKKLNRSQHHSLIFISFSAGVVGAIGAACLWQQWGNTVKAFIAVDGWGVPLAGAFPIHRLSHDKFTHWSSALLGKGQESFYAEPPTEHLALWYSPDEVTGWVVAPIPNGGEGKIPMTAAAFLAALLHRYEA